MKSLLLLGATMLYSSIIYAQGITIPYDAATVTVDGIMNTNEWAKAARTAIPVSATDSVNVYYKNDGTALYFAYTGKLESANALFPEILIDPQLAKGSLWTNGQWWFHVSATDCENNGAYGVYNNCQLIQPDWEGANNFVAGAPYTDTVEIRIPFSKINFNPATQSEMGIVFLVTNTASIWKLWPSTADRNIPSTWSGATVSKFPLVVNEPAPAIIKIYPNPAQTSIMFEGIMADSEIKLADVTGRVVVAQYYTGQPLTISSLLPGVYNVQVYHHGLLIAKQTIQKL
jgi:hypothetical protein